MNSKLLTMDSKLLKPYSEEFIKIFLEIFPNASEFDKQQLKEGNRYIGGCILKLSQNVFKPEDILNMPSKKLVEEAMRGVKAKKLMKMYVKHWESH